MQNLLNTLSEKLQKELKDYGVFEVFVDPFGELRVTSNYDMCNDLYEAIEAEVKANQKETEMGQDLTEDQKIAFREMGQLLMNSLNISKEEALNKIISIFEGMKEALDNGVLADHQITPVNIAKQ